mmetsp:Transcript_43423/g.114382  ORF Transcript_43423/g.114382 Transcript_43423/m.114382 type:complete len:219 (+) Transcript_43423:1029-1685(+)
MLHQGVYAGAVKVPRRRKITMGSSWSDVLPASGNLIGVDFVARLTSWRRLAWFANQARAIAMLAPRRRRWVVGHHGSPSTTAFAHASRAVGEGGVRSRLPVTSPRMERLLRPSLVKPISKPSIVFLLARKVNCRSCCQVANNIIVVRTQFVPVDLLGPTRPLGCLHALVSAKEVVLAFDGRLWGGACLDGLIAAANIDKIKFFRLLLLTLPLRSRSDS